MGLERIIDDFRIYQLRCAHSLVDLQVLPKGQALAAYRARCWAWLCAGRGGISEIVEHLAARGVPLQAGPMEL